MLHYYVHNIIYIIKYLAIIIIYLQIYPNKKYYSKYQDRVPTNIFIYYIPINLLFFIIFKK